MASRNGGAEILVHVSAPSTGRDDARYRAQAAAYLAFEPQRPRDSNETAALEDIEPELQIHDETQLQGSQYEEEVQRQWIPLFVDGDDSYEESQSEGQGSFQKTYLTRSHLQETLGILESPQVSFGSVLDNGDSPDLRHRSAVTGSEEKESQDWQTPLSEGHDSLSSHQRSIPPLSPPTGDPEPYLHKLPISSATSKGNTGAREGDDEILRSPPQIETSARTSLISQATGTVPFDPLSFSASYKEHDSIIPSSPPASSYNKLSDQSRDDDTIGSIQQSSPSPTRPDVKRQCKLLSHVTTHDCIAQPDVVDFRQSGLGEGTGILNSLPVPALSRTAAQGSPTAVIPQKRKQPVQDIQTTPPPSSPAAFRKPFHLRLNITNTTIKAPPPPTSTSTGPLNITTASLAHLASNLSLPTRYRPTSQTRSLRPLERGYWALSTETWGSAARQKAWRALGLYVAGGKAGWGVWCTRGDNKTSSRRRSSRSQQNATACGTENESDVAGEWRVYCFGDIVGHIFLLLYLISERRVKVTGARWLDGDGEVVIVVDGRR